MNEDARHLFQNEGISSPLHWLCSPCFVLFFNLGTDGFFSGWNTSPPKKLRKPYTCHNVTKKGWFLVEKFRWEIRMFDQQKKVARRLSQDVFGVEFLIIPKKSAKWSNFTDVLLHKGCSTPPTRRFSWANNLKPCEPLNAMQFLLALSTSLLFPLSKTLLTDRTTHGLTDWPYHPRFIFREIAEEHCYGLLQNLPSNSIVIDGGLNLGIFSASIGRGWPGCWFRPKKMVWYHKHLKTLKR